MNGLGFLIKTVAAFLIIFFASPSFATYSEQCAQSGKTAKTECEGAITAAGGADGAQAGANMAKSGNAINPNAGTLSGQIGDQVGRLQGAKAKCEAAKKRCESECEGHKAKAAQLPQPQNQTEPTKVDQKKQSDCIGAIVPLIAKLDSALGGLGANAGDSSKTGGSSGGMPMPLPIPLPSDKKGDESGTAGTNPTPDKLNCDVGNNQQYSDCNNHFIEKCQNAPDTAGCAPFIARYCGDTTPVPTAGNDNLAFEAQSTAVTANLVVGKSGEGLGSAFCKKITAYRYCQAAGRSECPSCKNINSPWPMESTPGALQAAQQACPTDPMFLDVATGAAGLGTSLTTSAPTLPGSVSTQSTSRDRTSTGGGIGSSGGGIATQSTGGAGGAGAAGGGPGGAVSEGYNGPSLAGGSGFAGGEGGGGGYAGSDYASSGGEASGPGYRPASVNGQAARQPNAAGPRADVGNQYGPNVFSIQSATYRDLCNRGRFLHCRR